MDILIILLITLCLWGAKFSLRGHDDYAGREQTTAVKGIFALLILLSHSRGYLDPEACAANGFLFTLLLDKLGQLIVVMFMFYSGYGIMEALKRDRRHYIATFPTRRLLKVWLLFAIAVVLYEILNLALGNSYPVDHILLSFIGWTSIGNSNWFVFVILALYLLTYIAMLAADRLGLSPRFIVAATYAMTALLLAGLVAAGKDVYWYDTMLAYPTGMLFSTLKPRIEHALRGRRWLIAALAVAALFAACYAAGPYTPLTARPDATIIRRWAFHLAAPCLFALLVVMLTMKLRIHNPLLYRIGVDAFAIYILQRLAMIAGARLGLNSSPLLFVAAVTAATLLIAALYTKATKRLLTRK